LLLGRGVQGRGKGGDGDENKEQDFSPSDGGEEATHYEEGEGSVVVRSLEFGGFRGSRLGVDGFAVDFDDFHLEDEDGAAGNARRRAAVAVAELRRNIHLPFIPLHHELHSLGPTLDDLQRSIKIHKKR